eukprot:3282679-Karenia_brevis.AAC.1
METLKEMENRFVEVRRRNQREKNVRFNKNVRREGCEDKGCCEDRWVCPVEKQGKKTSISFQ